MPEGDTVYRVARSLRHALAGTTLVSGGIRTPELAHKDMAGLRIEDVDSYGKHLLIHFPGHVLRSHMRMDGVWHVYRQGARWRKPSHQARIVLANEASQVVGFMVSDIDLVTTQDLPSLIGHLGPDVLKPNWETQGLQIAIDNLSRDERPVHVALLDQTNVAGFGNEYANELCFLQGLNPWQPASEVDVEALLRLGRRIIKANLARTARTTTGNLAPGRRLHVYGRSDRACARCNTPIRVGEVGADPTRRRIVYWCPRCQPMR